MNRLTSKDYLRGAAMVICGALVVLCISMFGPKPAQKPVAARENGVITADEWAAMYPDIVASYKATAENTYRVSYLDDDQDPYLKNIYEGFGFAKDYTSAIGHEYCLEDVAKTERPHALANCLTCKTADFTALVNKMGADAYSLSFDEVLPDMQENVGCYSCHGNEADEDGKLVVTHDYFVEKLDMSNINAATLSCGQCHIEYYFKADNKAVTIPYTNTSEMSPEAMLAYYDAMDFADWTQESTGARLLKAQHPEFETYLGAGSKHVGFGLSCADCHMAKATNAAGEVYTDHNLVSPLESPAILENCAQCHGGTDMVAFVHEIQDQVTGREKEIGVQLSNFKDALAAANASGSLSEEQLEAARYTYRAAQWYFDFEYVENAEGAHNSMLANSCLDTAVELIEEGMAQLSGTASAAPAEWKLDAPDGTYSSTKQGFGGEIVGEVVISGGKVTAINVTGNSETEGLGSVAVAKLPGRIMKAQTLNVDGISGATISSTAIKDALTEAFAQAGVDATKLEGVAAGPVVKTEETRDVDVVIVGAGGAGMSAAITAKQAGKNVLILEKMPYVGGNTTKASGGMNAAGTKMQAAAAAAETDEKIKATIEDSTVENFIADTIKSGHDINDPALVRTMAENSSDAIDWLESIGAPLPKIAATGSTVHMYLHEPEDGSAVGEYLVKSFSDLLEEMEIPVLMETKATEIISENGQAVGVKAESESVSYTINAKAVILATGGFGANEEMYCSFRPDLKGTVTTNTPGATGDGIVMAQAMGADLTDIDQIQLHPTVFQKDGMLVSERVRSNGAILVNENGQRFVNDLLGRDIVSGAELEQPNCNIYIVYDSQFVEEKLYQKYDKLGMPVMGETLEELAAAMGFDATATANFVETVAKWNAAVGGEAEDEFGRNNGLISLTEAPFYAINIAPGIHHTMGGLKIDTETHVIDTDGNVIPGLFAAGEVTGGVHGGNRVGGNAVADIVVYGRIAGANACAFADAQ